MSEKAKSTIELDTKAVVTAVVISLLLGAIGGIYGYSRLTESNTFTISTLVDGVKELKETKVDKDIYEIQQQYIREELGRQNEKLDKLVELMSKHIEMM